jgi:GNAT superfamily N-acetyltransferase
VSGHATPSLAQLFHAQGEGWRAFMGAAERGESWAAPGVSVGIGGEASPDLNWVVAYGPDGVAEGIAAAVKVLRRRNLPGSLFAASTVADEAAAVARELGLSDAGHVPFMCVRPSDAVRVAEGHETRLVDDLDGILAAGDILADAFELPVDWCRRLLGAGFGRLTDASAYLALHDGRPVAVAGSARVGDIAGIYAVGTRSSHRRRGAGAVALSAVMDLQLRTGARRFGLYSAPDAEAFYAELGFVAVDHPGRWVLGPA